MCYCPGNVEKNGSHPWGNISNQESEIDNVNEWLWEFPDKVHWIYPGHIHKFTYILKNAQGLGKEFHKEELI